MIQYVIAHNTEDFQSWLETTDVDKSISYKYLANVEKCRGLRRVPILAIPNWDKRKDAVDMIAELRGRGCNFIYPEEN